MAVDMTSGKLVLAKASPVQVSTDISAQARMAGRPMNGIGAVVPAEVDQAMQQQGMNTGAFSPGQPITPYEQIGTDPIVTPYPVGHNIFAIPRGSGGVAFDTLKRVTTMWDVAQLCIEVRLDELKALDWEITLDEGVNADMYSGELAAARAFFEHPAPGDDFDDLQSRAGEDWLRYDAATLARRRTRNGKLGALEAIDGTLIAPLVDGRGSMPTGNAPAYVQWAWGLPWTWLMDRDIIYKPNHPRTHTRYGMPPAEWVMLSANTDVRLQYYFLQYFTEGTVPEAFVQAPEGTMEPRQVEQLQDAYEKVMKGKLHHRWKWIPPKSQVTVVNKANFDVDFAGWMLTKGCASFKVQPAEIGYTERVNKSSSDSQSDITYRRTLKPTVKYWESIWNKILREDLNMPYAKFRYLNIEEEEDQLKLAQVRKLYVEMAALSADEVRQELGYEIDQNNPVGRAFVQTSGVVFVDQQSKERAREQGTLGEQAGLPAADGQDEQDFLNPDQAVPASSVHAKPQEATGPEEAPPTRGEKAIESDLRKWREVAVRRAKDGKLQRAFVSDVIPPALHKAITDELDGPRTPDEVRDVFSMFLDEFRGRVPFLQRAQGGKRQPVARGGEKYNAAEKDIQKAVAGYLSKTGPNAAKKIRSRIEKGELPSLDDEAAVETFVNSAIDTVEWETWENDFMDVLKPAIVEAYKVGVEAGLNDIGAMSNWSLVEPQVVAYADKRAAELVGKQILPDGTIIDNPNPDYTITEATRDSLRSSITQSLQDGKSPYQIEQAIKTDYAFNDSRAETIARTETGFAFNRGSIGAWRASGLQEVDVYDGEDFDDECAEANGQRWTLDEAEANPLEHPNCTRAFAPVVPEMEEDES